MTFGGSNANPNTNMRIAFNKYTACFCFFQTLNPPYMYVQLEVSYRNTIRNAGNDNSQMSDGFDREQRRISSI